MSRSVDGRARNADGDPRPNQVIGDWQLTPIELGSGSFGDVRVAVNVKTGARAAVKTPRRTPVNGVALMRREVRIHQPLRHRSIVEMLEAVPTPDGRQIIFMELCEGETVRQRVTRLGAVPRRDAQRLYRHLAAGLRYLHDVHQVAHGDLKLSNLLVTDSGRRLKICDFGLAERCVNQSGHVTVHAKYHGCRHFVAPEVLARHLHECRAADVWSATVCLMLMLTGRQRLWDEPSLTDEEYETWRARLGTGHERDLVDRCLVVNPANRLSAAEILEQPFLRPPTPPPRRTSNLSDPAPSSVRRR
ncbi:MAG: serine/threonine-protein kinase [Planctomycetota bacterium]